LNVEHDPEKWTPVSRLREADLWRKIILKSASAGEGRSEKIMLQLKIQTLIRFILIGTGSRAENLAASANPRHIEQ